MKSLSPSYKRLSPRDKLRQVRRDRNYLITVYGAGHAYVAMWDAAAKRLVEGEAS